MNEMLELMDFVETVIGLLLVIVVPALAEYGLMQLIFRRLPERKSFLIPMIFPIVLLIYGFLRKGGYIIYSFDKPADFLLSDWYVNGICCIIGAVSAIVGAVCFLFKCRKQIR